MIELIGDSYLCFGEKNALGLFNVVKVVLLTLLRRSNDLFTAKVVGFYNLNFLFSNNLLWFLKLFVLVWSDLNYEEIYKGSVSNLRFYDFILQSVLKVIFNSELVSFLEYYNGSRFSRLLLYVIIFFSSTYGLTGFRKYY